VVGRWPLRSEEHPAVARFFQGTRVRRRRDRECRRGDRRHRRIGIGYAGAEQVAQPGAPRSRAVLITIARTSVGCRAGLRSSSKTTSPLPKAAEKEVPEVTGYLPSGAGRQREWPMARQPRH
jgi:hypothetical protein